MSAAEWNEVARLAIARYPKRDPRLAVMQFWSDRRAAGLGALEPGKRQPMARRSRVVRLKIENADKRQMHYILKREPMQAFNQHGLPTLTELMQLGADLAKLKTTVVTVPGYDYVLPVDLRDFLSQRGRRDVALALRRTRREIHRLHPLEA